MGYLPECVTLDKTLLKDCFVLKYVCSFLRVQLWCRMWLIRSISRCFCIEICVKYEHISGCFFLRSKNVPTLKKHSCHLEYDPYIKTNSERRYNESWIESLYPNILDIHRDCWTKTLCAYFVYPALPFKTALALSVLMCWSTSTAGGGVWNRKSYVLWSVTPGQSIDRPAGVKQLTVAHSLAPFAAVIGGCDDR